MAKKLTVLILVALCAGGCVTDRNPTKSARTEPQLKASLAEADYSAYLARCSHLDAGKSGEDLPPAVRMRLRELQDNSFRTYEKHAPNPREVQLLGVTVLPSGAAVNAMDTYQRIAGYFVRHHAAPPDGAACLDYLDDPAQLKHFSALSEEQRMQAVVPLVNPLTGHLYASFANPAEPFGFAIRFEPVTSADFPPGGVEPLPGRKQAHSGCAECSADSQVPPAGQPAGQQSSSSKDPFKVLTPEGEWPVHWECLVTRYGEVPGTVLERSEFIF